MTLAILYFAGAVITLVACLAARAIEDSYPPRGSDLIAVVVAVLFWPLFYAGILGMWWCRRWREARR